MDVRDSEVQIDALRAVTEFFRVDVLKNQKIRVLLVDDYAPWRRFISTALGQKSWLKLIAEVANGIEAVQQAQLLRPDLILLDIALPGINGIQAARQILAQRPRSKILFASSNRCLDVVEEALSTGALGYLLKSDAGNELLPGLRTALEGKRFISSTLSASLPSEPAFANNFPIPLARQQR